MDCLGFLLLNKAVFLYNPGKISIYKYFGSVVQLVFDLTIFKVEFYTVQMLGMLIIFSSNIILIFTALTEHK